MRPNPAPERGFLGDLRIGPVETRTPSNPRGASLRTHLAVATPTAWPWVLVPSLIALAGARTELPARTVPWSEMDERVFPSAWVLPAECWTPARPADSLENRLRELCGSRFGATPDAPWQQSVGDLVLEHRRRGGSRAQLREMLAAWSAAHPDDRTGLVDVVSELLSVDALGEKKWDPSDDRGDDGVLFGPDLARRELPVAPWKDLRGSLRIHQAAVLVHADLEALFEALHDYASALHDVGTSYEKLSPRRDTIVQGRDEEHGPFAALRLDIRSDLPFPFSHYDCDLGTLHRLDAGGHPRTYVFGQGRDFYWLAGSDVLFPVRAADGRFAGMLVVRLSGFDLRGVPDDDDDRKSGTRAALGNWKRRAEKSFRSAGGVPRTIEGALPGLRVVAEGP